MPALWKWARGRALMTLLGFLDPAIPETLVHPWVFQSFLLKLVGVWFLSLRNELKSCD